MSKKFKTQDYFRYPRLGKRWRRPKGFQSKLRLKKGGSGRLVSIGYGTEAVKRNTIRGVNYVIVSNPAQIERAEGKSVIIASGVGAKKAAEIANKAKELKVKILNMKKIKRSMKILKKINEKKSGTVKK